MRISDWSSDVCSSDLRSTLLESDGGGTRARTARPRPICRYADMAARRHFDQDRPDEHGGQPGGARAFARLPPERIRREPARVDARQAREDRKSTRLNYSH